MAFFDINDYSSKFPSGYDTNKAARAWNQIEAGLIRLGFVFNAPTSTTHELSAKDSYTAVFDCYIPFSDVTAIKRARYGVGPTHTYEEGLEYIAHQHPNLTGYVTQIELLRDRSLRKPDYIELTGKKGVYIDTTDTDSLGNKLLINAIIDTMVDILNAENSAAVRAQGIKSSSTGKTSVSFGQSSYEETRQFDLLDLWSIDIMADALGYFINPMHAFGT